VSPPPRVLVCELACPAVGSSLESSHALQASGAAFFSISGLLYFSREAVPLLSRVFRSPLVFLPWFSPRRPVSLEGHAAAVPAFAPHESLLSPESRAAGSSSRKACRLLVLGPVLQLKTGSFRLVLLDLSTVLDFSPAGVPVDGIVRSREVCTAASPACLGFRFSLLSSDVTPRPVVGAATHRFFSLFNVFRGAVPLLFSVLLSISAPGTPTDLLGSRNTRRLCDCVVPRGDLLLRRAVQLMLESASGRLLFRSENHAMARQV
jgi:hypothetical protein